MIGFQVNGIVDTYGLKKEECIEYIEKEFGKTGNVINSICHTVSVIKPVLKSDCEVIFDYRTNKICLVDCAINRIVVAEIDISKAQIGSNINFEDLIVGIYEDTWKEDLTVEFKCKNTKSFNDCIVGLELMTKISKEIQQDKTKEIELNQLLQKEKEIREEEERIKRFNEWFFKKYRCKKCGKSDEWNTNVCLVKDNEEFSWGGECRNCKTPHYEKGNMQSYTFPVPIYERIPTFKEKFLKEYHCPKCSRINMWYDVDFNVDDNGNYNFSASCKVCDRFVYEYGNFLVDQIPQSKDEVIVSTKKAPWEIQYLDHPCPYCGKYKVRYAKWDDKSWSAAFWGFFSHKVHSNYKCDNCKEMWE